jgi:K+-sensing histidine kinase KdpD
MPTPADRRPDPEELLRRVQVTERRANRGRLKIFLGYASRVGKSFRMFDEGRRRKERGQDVVVGAVQRGVTPDIAEILSRLEVVPSIAAKYAGQRADGIIAVRRTRLPSKFEDYWASRSAAAEPPTFMSRTRV